jgi:hypothetical protein
MLGFLNVMQQNLVTLNIPCIKGIYVAWLQGVMIYLNLKQLRMIRASKLRVYYKVLYLLAEQLI